MSMERSFLTLVFQFRAVELYVLLLTPLYETLQATIAVSIISYIDKYVIDNALHTSQVYSFSILMVLKYLARETETRR